MDLLGGLGTGTTITGELLKVFGSLQKGYESKFVQDLNATISRANAQAIQTSGEFDVRRMRKAKGRLASSQVAGYSKAGVKLQGSAIEVMIDSAAEAETDILISEYNTKVGVIQANYEAESSRIAGKQAVAQAGFGAAQSLLSLGMSFAGGFKSTSKLPTSQPRTSLARGRY